MARYKSLKYACEFNKITLALATAGLFTDAKFVDKKDPVFVLILLMVSALSFVISTVYALMVFGRASLIVHEDFDEKISQFGRNHLVFFVIGLVFLLPSWLLLVFQ